MALSFEPVSSWACKLRGRPCVALSHQDAVLNRNAPQSRKPDIPGRLVLKHFAPRLPREGKAVLAVLTARVGSISDNRLGGWYGYRAAKAAANQLVRTTAIELAARRKDAICVALHPGTVDTPLSAPFQKGVSSDKLFTPTLAAERLLSVIEALTPEKTGHFLAWDRQDIPF